MYVPSRSTPSFNSELANTRSQTDRKGGKKGGGQGSGKGERYSYVSIVSENEKYERYYKESGLIPEEEWSDFWAALKRTLPTTFRFTGSKGYIFRLANSVMVEGD